MLNILLLDCSKEIEEKLKKQGFNIAAGTVGYCNGIKSLPNQIYESEIIIYDPRKMAVLTKAEGNCYMPPGRIDDKTPEFNLTHLSDHIKNGATILVFLNRVCNNIDAQENCYNWIPFMPKIEFTKDARPFQTDAIKNYNYKHFSPIVSEQFLKKPVLQKITPREPGEHSYPVDVAPFFCNQRGDVLGVHLIEGRGGVIVLPECENNDDIISSFLHRVVPKIYNLNVKTNPVDEYQSPAERARKREAVQIEKNIEEYNEKLELVKEQIEEAKRQKNTIISSNFVANQVTKYYNLATQQDEVALFYLYKIIETLEHLFKSEKLAKEALDCNKEWNIIGKIANASYGDMGHAPKPGEVIKEWTCEEIKDCFDAAKTIMLSYFEYIFIHTE